MSNAHKEPCVLEQKPMGGGVFARRKSAIVSASQVTGATRIDTQQAITFVGRGDWLIVEEDGTVYPCSDEVFKRDYKPLTGSEPDSQEEITRLRAEVEALRVAIRALLACPDIADNDHKDEETHAAERMARAAIRARAEQEKKG